MLFGVEAAALSGMSILILISYKTYRAIRRVISARGLGQTDADACDSSLFLSLMVGETLRSIGKLMTIRWIQEARILAPTGYCTAQGMLQWIGTNIIDWSTLAITLQTWVILVAQWNAPTHLAKYMTLAAWVISGLIVGITVGVKGLGIIGPAGSWCWVTSEYRAEQILSEYLWMWIILVLTIVLYGVDVLVIKGYVTIEGSFRLRWVSRDRVRVELFSQADNTDERERKQMALQLAFYPLVYFICVLPASITRWMQFSGHRVPHQAAAFTSCLFSLSGLFNVILFFKTRPQLITGGDIAPTQHSGHGITPQHGQLPREPPQEKDSANYAHQDEGKFEATEYYLHPAYEPGARGRSQSSHYHSGTSILPKDRQVSTSPGRRAMNEDDDDDVGYLPR